VTIKSFPLNTKPIICEFPLYIGLRGGVAQIPRAIQLANVVIRDIFALNALLVQLGVAQGRFLAMASSQGKGERNIAKSSSGTDNPFKHMKPDPNNPKRVLEKDTHTGKQISKPKPEGFDEYWNNKK